MTVSKSSAGLGQDPPPSAIRSKAPHRGVLLALVCAGIFIVYLDATVVNVALPAMQRELGMSVTGAQWVINIYVLVFACLLLTAGTLADIVGRKSVFLTGLVGFTLASVSCAVAPSSPVLLIGRGLQGACASLVIPVSLAIISDLYEAGHARAQAMGIWSGLGGLALAIGPAVGGLLVEGFNWRASSGSMCRLEPWPSSVLCGCCRKRDRRHGPASTTSDRLSWSLAPAPSPTR